MCVFVGFCVCILVPAEVHKHMYKKTLLVCSTAGECVFGGVRCACRPAILNTLLARS